jgi:hypothetical protein
MSGIQFEEDNISRVPLEALPLGGITGWLIKNGFAKNRSNAEKILIGLAVVLFVWLGSILFGTDSENHIINEAPSSVESGDVTRE